MDAIRMRGKGKRKKKAEGSAREEDKRERMN